MKSLDAFFTSFSGPIYLVLNIDNQADSYVEMKKKVAITKKKPGIFTVNDIQKKKKKKKKTTKKTTKKQGAIALSLTNNYILE